MPASPTRRAHRSLSWLRLSRRRPAVVHVRPTDGLVFRSLVRGAGSRKQRRRLFRFPYTPAGQASTAGRPDLGGCPAHAQTSATARLARTAHEKSEPASRADATSIAGNLSLAPALIYGPKSARRRPDGYTPPLGSLGPSQPRQPRPPNQVNDAVRLHSRARPADRPPHVLGFSAPLPSTFPSKSDERGSRALLVSRLR